MVVDGVTSIQGERESRSQGKVAQGDEMFGNFHVIEMMQVEENRHQEEGS